MSSKGGGNERFNAEAAAWDSNPDVHRASDGALQAILAAYPSLSSSGGGSSGGSSPPNTTDVLEIGCGTGLLSLRLAPYVRSIVAVDAAEGMVKALEVKLEGDEAMRAKISPLCLMLEDPEDKSLPPADPSQPDGPRRKFDLVTSHLVLHHIADLRGVLTTMYGCLQPGTGHVALTDYEDFKFGAGRGAARRFHPAAKMGGVEHPCGIHAGRFARLMAEVGFVDVCVEAAWTMEKEVERFPGEWGGEKLETRPGDGGAEVMGFPFLLCRGRRGT